MSSDIGPRWQHLGESAAATYERLLAPAMFAPWVPVLLDMAGIESGDRVLDVACGTGIVTRAAAERVGATGRIVGLDFSASMLAVAREAAATPGVDIEWVEASALEMPFPAHSFNVVLCQHGLQQIPDRLAALNEMRRVLEPGGQVAICAWSRIEANPGMAALIEALGRHVGSEAARNRRGPFVLSDPEALHALLTNAGFREVSLQTVNEVTRFHSSEELVEGQLAATPLATAGAIDDATRAAIHTDVRSALRPYQRGGTLAAPIESHIAIARV